MTDKLSEQIAQIIDKNAITECQQKCPPLEDSETCEFCKADQILALSPLKELLSLLEQAGGDIGNLKVVKPYYADYAKKYMNRELPEATYKTRAGV